MRIVSASVIVVLAFLLAGTTTPVSGAAETTRRVYISAVDSTGAQVTDLTAGDLTVKEDGKEPAGDRPRAGSCAHAGGHPGG